MTRTVTLVGVAAMLLACGGDGPTDPPRPSAILVKPDVRSIIIGDTARLSATVVDAGGDTVRGVSARWTSADTSIATVDASGVVRGRTAGSVRIIARVGGDTASAGVTVRRPVSTLEVSGISDTLMIGRQFRVFVTARDAAGAAAPDAPLTWTSSDTTVVAVDETGWLRARSYGSATITISTQSATFTRTVLVRFKHVDPLRRWRVVDVGGGYACALTTDDEPMCWGGNLSGRLGYADPSASSPKPVSGGHRLTSISAGNSHTCGIDRDSTAWCWGSAGNGQLGTGATMPSTSQPQRVASDHRWKQIVAAGHGTSCAIASDDVPYCWGHNDLGQLGRPAPNRSADPTIVRFGDGAPARAVAGDDFLTCAVRLNGETYCSGSLYRGNAPPDTGNTTATIAVAGGHRFRSIAIGDVHTCAVTEAGPAYCWGWSVSTGTLGTGVLSEERPTPAAVEGGHAFVTVTAGDNHTCGLTSQGVAWCWGANGSGQLGSGVPNASAVPVRVPSPHIWRSISAGGNATCGITPDDSLYCWGGGFHQ